MNLWEETTHQKNIWHSPKKHFNSKSHGKCVLMGLECLIHFFLWGQRLIVSETERSGEQKQTSFFGSHRLSKNFPPGSKTTHRTRPCASPTSVGHHPHRPPWRRHPLAPWQSSLFRLKNPNKGGFKRKGWSLLESCWVGSWCFFSWMNFQLFSLGVSYLKTMCNGDAAELFTMRQA